MQQVKKSWFHRESVKPLTLLVTTCQLSTLAQLLLAFQWSIQSLQQPDNRLFNTLFWKVRPQKIAQFTVKVRVHPPTLFHWAMYRYFSGYLVHRAPNISSCNRLALSLPPSHPIPRGRAHPVSPRRVHVRLYTRKCCQMPSAVYPSPSGINKVLYRMSTLKYVPGRGRKPNSELLTAHGLYFDKKIYVCMYK